MIRAKKARELGGNKENNSATRKQISPYISQSQAQIEKAIERGKEIIRKVS